VNAVLCAASCVFGSIHAFAVPRAPHRHVAASAEKSVRRSKVLEMRRLATSENGDQSQSSTFDPNLSSSDPEVYAILQAESRRQRCGLELIASENFASKAVLQALGSVMANKYSEGIVALTMAIEWSLTHYSLSECIAFEGNLARPIYRAT